MFVAYKTISPALALVQSGAEFLEVHITHTALDVARHGPDPAPTAAPTPKPIPAKIAAKAPIARLVNRWRRRWTSSTG
jgi:hypothetical protein